MPKTKEPKRGRIISEEYYLEGVKVPKHVVMNPETLTVDEISTEKNPEVQRIMIQRFGIEKYLESLDNVVVLDSRDNDIDNTKESLISFTVNENNYKFLMATCPTGRVFFINFTGFDGTDELPDIKTCEEAQSFLKADETAKEIGVPPVNAIGRS